MADPEIPDLLRAERARLAVALRDLPAERWEDSTLCGRWTVRDVVAHLTAAASTPTLPWLATMVTSRFDTDRHNQRLLERHRGRDARETLRRFEAVAASTTAPFGALAGALGEVVVHGQDIALPLGLPVHPAPRALEIVLEFFARRDFAVDSRTVSRDLRLVATDLDVVHGEGPEVRGPAAALCLAIAGRPAGLAALTGDGADVLRERLSGR